MHCLWPFKTPSRRFSGSFIGEQFNVFGDGVGSVEFEAKKNILFLCFVPPFRYSLYLQLSSIQNSPELSPWSDSPRFCISPLLLSSWIIRNYLALPFAREKILALLLSLLTRIRSPFRRVETDWEVKVQQNVSLLKRGWKFLQYIQGQVDIFLVKQRKFHGNLIFFRVARLHRTNIGQRALKHAHARERMGTPRRVNTPTPGKELILP